MESRNGAAYRRDIPDPCSTGWFSYRADPTIRNGLGVSRCWRRGRIGRRVDFYRLRLGRCAGLDISDRGYIGYVRADGGLHEDGLADVADGFGGGNSRDRKLAIMRDSRIGTYGVSALIFSIGFRVAALASIAESGFTVSALILAGAISRSAIGPVMALLPQARPDGLSAVSGQPRSSQAWLGVALAFAIAWGFAGLSDVLVAICVTAVVVTAVATIAKRQIDGQTGDVLGAVAQVGEVAVLVTLSAR